MPHPHKRRPAAYTPERAVQLLNGASWRVQEIVELLPPAMVPPWTLLAGKARVSWVAPAPLGAGASAADKEARRQKTCLQTMARRQYQELERQLRLSSGPEGRHKKAARRAFEAEARAKLRRYVDSWIESGRERSRWRAHASAVAAIRRAQARFPPVMAQSGTRSRGRKPAPGPRTLEVSVYSLEFNSDADRIESFCARSLLGILGSPDGVRVGKCAGCGRYYYARQRRGNQRFCSSPCKGRENARRNVGRQREREHWGKLQAASLALAAMPPDTHDWKGYIERGSQGQLSRPFLTRAAHRGELKPPPAAGDGPHV